MTSMTTSGDVSSDNSVPEYADQIKRLTSDVAAMKDEIDKLIQENQYLKQHNLEIL
jgi:regulator of replication initiation timing